MEFTPKAVKRAIGEGSRSLGVEDRYEGASPLQVPSWASLRWAEMLSLARLQLPDCPEVTRWCTEIAERPAAEKESASPSPDRRPAAGAGQLHRAKACSRLK